MRVFSKKKLTFINPKTKEQASVKPFTFSNLPDWASLDPLFDWAKEEGSLEVFGEDKPSVRSDKKGQNKKAEAAAKLEQEITEPKADGEQ